jgi:chromosome segregation ATPase
MADNQPYNRPHNEPDDQAARWMTFAELATIRGISKLSAVALVRRHGWRRQRDNQGHMTALVPAAWADTEPTNELTDQAVDKGDVSLTARSLAALEDAIAALRAAKDSEIATLHSVIDGLRASIARAEDRAGRAETDRDAERVRADRAEADRSEDRRRADDLRDRLTAMQEQLADAHAALQAAAEADARAKQAERNRERAEASLDAERGRAGSLRAQIDELNAEMVVARAEAAAHAEAGRAEERQRADAINALLEATQEELAGQRELTDQTRADAERAHAEAEALRQAEDERRARGRWARLRVAWRGE